jgi:GntR family negative regulator for fad regulon and positive regulator of fabA
MKRSYEMVERALVNELLRGVPATGSHLQSERDLAARFGVSRATVREALLRLQNAGWISIQERHATQVNDFWKTGDLELLASITRNSDPFPLQLAIHLLELRLQIAPDYARRAVENAPKPLIAHLATAVKLRNNAGTVANFDWELHLSMAVLSGNKIYPMILNSLADLYAKLRGEFFAKEEHRMQAKKYYAELATAAVRGDADDAEALTRAAMRARLESCQQEPLIAETLEGETAAGKAAEDFNVRVFNATAAG